MFFNILLRSFLFKSSLISTFANNLIVSLEILSLPFISILLIISANNKLQFINNRKINEIENLKI